MPPSQKFQSGSYPQGGGNDVNETAAESLSRPQSRRTSRIVRRCEMLRNNRPARQAAGNPAGTASSKPSRLIEQACLDGGCAVVSVSGHGSRTHNRRGITVKRRRRIARAPTTIMAMAIRSPTDLVRGRGHAQASLVDDRHHTGAGRKRRDRHCCANRTGRSGFCERRHLYLLQLTRENLEVCSRSFFFSPGLNTQLVQLAEPSRPGPGAFRSLQRNFPVSREFSCRDRFDEPASSTSIFRKSRNAC